MNSSARASLAACITITRGIAGSPSAMVSWIVRLNRMQNDADLSAQPAGIELGDVDPADHHLAVSRTVKALDELRQRRLA
jgi:hypothetical protein